MPARRSLGRTNRLVALIASVKMELDEDDGVLDDRSQGAQEPRQSPQEVALLLRVHDEACAIGKVAGQGQQEEKQGEALARLFAVVLQDLGDAGTAGFGSAC